MNVLSFQFLYRIMLRLFPRNFYTDFAEEMQSVFTDVMTEAASRGRIAEAQAALRELVWLPVEALRLHLIPRLLVAGARPSGWEGPPTRKEVLLVLAVFALPVLGLFYRETTFLSTRWPVYLATGLVLGVLIAGFFKGFPRWSLPYLGLVLSTASFFLLIECGADLLSPLALNRLGIVNLDESTRLLLEAAWSGLLWLGLFCMIALGLGVLALFKRCRVMLQRIRQDWTLASYILYSGVLAVLGLSFARHLSHNIYAIASILCLGMGAWLFLRSPRAWQRVLALLGGLTLAVSAAVAGQWPLHPLYAWESTLRLENLGRSGTLLAALEWGWMSVVIIAPVLLRFLPGKSRQRMASP